MFVCVYGTVCLFFRWLQLAHCNKVYVHFTQFVHCQLQNTFTILFQYWLLLSTIVIIFIAVKLDFSRRIQPTSIAILLGYKLFIMCAANANAFSIFSECLFRSFNCGWMIILTGVININNKTHDSVCYFFWWNSKIKTALYIHLKIQFIRCYLFFFKKIFFFFIFSIKLSFFIMIITKSNCIMYVFFFSIFPFFILLYKYFYFILFSFRNCYI